VAVNRRHNRYLSDLPVADMGPSVRISHKSKAPLKQMVLDVVGSEARNPPSLSLAPANRSTYVYQDLLQQHMVPWIQRRYPDGSYIFQQDSVPAHTARTTQQFFRETMAEFWSLADWPPYSLGLNPQDFSIWSVLQEKVQETPHTSLVALRQYITRQWNRMPPAYIRWTCCSFLLFSIAA
jgi:hypothetical protein